VTHILPTLWPGFSRLLLALFFGSIIGWQRQVHGSPAGLRTHILVCVAANLLTSVDFMTPGFQGKLPAAVITGVGFLGAGTILRSDKGDSVHGLTTAASVWATAGIGIALGAGGAATYMGAFVAILVLGTLSAVYSLEEFALRHTRQRNLTVKVASPDDTDVDETIDRFVCAIKDMGVAVEKMRKEKKSDDKSSVLVHLRLHLPDGFSPEKILRAATSDDGVIEAQWEVQTMGHL
jgi:putative Mg2+ transporter-C (MgtC) family protein